MNLELIENVETENKVKLNTGNEYQQWFKTLCAFSNTNGGVMNVGITDDLKEIGFTIQEIDCIKRNVETICKNHSKPILKCKFETVQIKNGEEKYYLRIIVEKRPSTITWLIDASSNPLLYVRHNGSTDLATFEEQIDLLNTANLYEYDQVETGISLAESKFEDLEEEYKSSNNNESLTIKKLISFGLVTSDHYLTVAGVLFADNSISKNANIVCTTWPSLRKGTNDYTDSKTYHGSLISLLHKSISYVLSVNNYNFGGEKIGLYRREKGSFSMLAIREALVNALAHRDYKIDGNEIAINCFPDRIEISSPGSMLQLRNDIVRVKMDPDRFPSVRRNKVICSIFEKCNLMENKGSGFEKIIEDYKDLSDEYAPLISSNKISFTIILKNKKYIYNDAITKNNVDALEFDEMIQKPMFSVRTNLDNKNPRYKEIESLVYKNKNTSIEEIASKIALSKDGVKYNIRKMKDACLIRRGVSGYELVNDSDRPADCSSLDKDTLMRAINWCKENFISSNATLKDYTSYDYKQLMEDEINLFLSNGQFKGVMLLAGFQTENIEELNWVFNVSENSPAIIKMRLK